MGRRWSPGKGFIRVLDYGRTAVWMQPVPQGGVIIAVYTWARSGDDSMRDVWVVSVPADSDLPYHVIDKPHRIGWADPHDGEMVLVHRTVPASDRGYRRHSPRRAINRWPLPRPLRAALDVESTGVWWVQVDRANRAVAS